MAALALHECPFSRPGRLVDLAHMRFLPLRFGKGSAVDVNTQ